MKREDVLKLFPEASDEQITSLLNQTNSEMASVKKQSEGYKASASETDALRKELEALKSQGLSESEKAEKALKDANAERDKLLAELNSMKFRQALSDNGVTGEMAEGIAKAFLGGDFESIAKSIGQISSESETRGATTKERELALGATNPSGGKTDNDSDKKTETDKIVDSVVSSFSSGANSNDVIANYK